MLRQHASSGSPLEPTIGFSHAVRVGPFVSVAGTAPIGAHGETVAPGDPAGSRGTGDRPDWLMWRCT